MASPHIRYGGDGDPDWGLSCGELILTSLQRLQNVTQPAQVDARLGTTMSFRELLLQTVHVTEGWRLMGLVPGDVVALVSRNRHEMFPAVLGAVCAGLSVACTVPSSTTAELRHALSLSQPKVVVSESAWLTRTLEAAPAGVRHVALMEEPPEGVTSYLELLRSGEAVEPPLDPDTYRAVDVGDRTESSPFILFSSGTTGLPKGVRLRDSALTLFLENPMFWHATEAAPVDDGGSVSGVAVLTSAPLCWISSVLQSLYAIVYGITRVFLVDPDNVTTMATIDKYKPRSWVVAPTTIASFASLYEHRYRHRYSLSSLHSLSVGGSTVSSEVQAMLQDQLGCRIVQVYGSTEAGVVFNADGQEPLGSIGKLVNVDSGEDIPASTRNVVGEARVRSPYLMHSFVNNPDETAKALDELGFYKTGDLMYEDDNGYFFFVDRIKEMIKYKNNQIAPAEIEMVLLQHPGVNEVCVLGRVSTVDIGDLPTAFVSRAANDAGAALTEAQLQDMVASTLSEYKQLRGGIVFMDRLPKTVTGKIARQKLKEVLKTIS